MVGIRERSGGSFGGSDGRNPAQHAVSATVSTSTTGAARRSHASSACPAQRASRHAGAQMGHPMAHGKLVSQDLGCPPAAFGAKCAKRRSG
jgi:hypothetical protein